MSMKMSTNVVIKQLTFDGENDPFADGGWNSVLSDAKVSSHLCSRDPNQIQNFALKTCFL